MDNGYYIVAYWPADQEHLLYEFWPEIVGGLNCMQEGVEIEFNSRFQEPDWWKELHRGE